MSEDTRKLSDTDLDVASGGGDYYVFSEDFDTETTQTSTQKKIRGEIIRNREFKTSDDSRTGPTKNQDHWSFDDYITPQ